MITFGPRALRPALVAASLALYALLFGLLHGMVGDVAASLTALPIVVAGSVMGLRGGLAVWALAIPLNAALFAAAGRAGWAEVVLLSPGLVAGLAIGAATGGLSELLRRARAQEHLLASERERLREQVTERRRAEAALRESEERLRLILHQLPAVVWTTDRDLRFTSSLGAGLAALGLRPNQVVGMTIPEFFQTDDPAFEPIAAHARALAGESVTYQIAWAGRVYHSHVEPLRDAAGGTVGVVGIARDITERKQADEEIRRLNAELEDRIARRTAELADRQRELAEAKAFLEHLIAASPGILFQVDPAAGRIAYVSPNIEPLLGYAPAELVGEPYIWRRLMHPDDRAPGTADRPAALQPGSRFRREIRVRHRDGTYRWFDVVGRCEGGDGRALRLTGHGVDITERKAAEEAVRRAREEADRANRAKSEFLSRMSHELRTPLNAMLGFAQLLDMDALSGEQRESVRHILDAGRHLLQLISEVLDIARIEAGRVQVTLQPIEVGPTVREALDLVRPLADQRRVRLRSEIPDEVGDSVLADAQRLRQIILNLLSNAVKYNREGGEAVVLAVQENGRLRLAVRDTGPGIPPERMSELFVPFRRLGAEQSGVEGAGLGLAHSKALAELMGGAIGVESTVGQGSTFWVDLPLASAEAVPGGAAS